MRERFPADAPLRQVVAHIAGRHPSLPAFSLLQGFPRKRFGEAELACSLRSLGLTPNAALCIQTTPPETPADPPSPAPQPVSGLPQEEPTPPPAPAPAPVPMPAPEHQPAPPLREVPVMQEEQEAHPGLPPPLPHQLWEEALGYAGIPGVGPPLSGPSHFWGEKT